MAASDCGQMRPGNTSDLQYLSVTNIGSRAVYVTVTADCGAEPLFISDPLVDSATQGHNQITLAADESECAPLALPDHASRGVVVWAEAHSA
jgi:hypothetical protein